MIDKVVHHTDHGAHQDAQRVMILLRSRSSRSYMGSLFLRIHITKPTKNYTWNQISEVLYHLRVLIFAVGCHHHQSKNPLIGDGLRWRPNEHVPEVQKRDQEIYFPFSLTRSSKEHNHQANIIAPLLLENNVAAHVICNDVIGNTTVDAINDKRQDAVSDHDAVNNIKDNNNLVINNEVANNINGGPSESAPSELNDPNCKNKERVRKDPMPCKNNTQHRNLERKKLQKFRRLPNRYGRPSESASSEPNDPNCKNKERVHEDPMLFKNNTQHRNLEGSFLEVDPEDESNDDTLSTSIEKKKDVRQNCKNRGALKEKRRTSQAVKRNLVGAKWTKHATVSSCSKDSELGSTSFSGLRKNKIGRFDMQVMNKLKRSTPEIVYENSGAACLDGQENTSEIKKDSLLLAGKERKRKTTQEDIAMMILKLRDGSWRHLTVEENRSDLSDAEIMVASWLIEFSAGVKAKKSNTETIQPTASACGLPQGKQDESEICVMNRNPSELSAVKAKIFMRCGLKIAKGEK